MKGTTIAIVGLSGVGKTTLISQFLKEYRSAIHVSAGRLLSKYRSVQDADKLRVLAKEQIEANQAALVEAFKDFRNENPASNILFDGHCVIDNDVELVRIPLEVFAGFSLDSFVFVKAPPSKIVERRTNDHLRTRPRRTLSEIDEQQRIAEEIIRSYSRTLNVLYLIVDSDMCEDFSNFLLSRLSELS